MNRIRAGRIGGGTIENETVALLTRFTTDATGARAVIINDTIAALKNAGLWAKLDAFYMLATAASDQALLNWKGTSFSLTTNGTITFAADQGYTGNGTTGYLDTQFNPTTAPTPQFTQNSVHLGLYSRTNASSANSAMGNDTAFMTPLTASQFQARLHRTSSYVAAANADSRGYFAISRTVSTDTVNIINSTTFDVANATNGAPSNQNIWICGRNGTTPQYNAYQIACAHFGSGLTAGELRTIAGIVTSHLARIGAAV